MTLTKEQRRQLQLIDICPPNQRKSLLKKIPKSGIHAISNCCHNLLNNKTFKISKSQINSLLKYKKTIRELASKKTPLFKKRKLIVQKGGFLNILIPAAISTLSAIINGFR